MDRRLHEGFLWLACRGAKELQFFRFKNHQNHQKPIKSTDLGFYLKKKMVRRVFRIGSTQKRVHFLIKVFFGASGLSPGGVVKVLIGGCLVQMVFSGGSRSF